MAQSSFPGSGSQFSLGTYDSKAVAQKACDAANDLIKKTETIGDVESMKKACKSAAEKATGTSSRNTWTAAEDVQVLAVGSRDSQVAIGDWSVEQAKQRWTNLHKKKAGTSTRKTWTVAEDAQVLAVGSRAGQVAIGDWTIGQAKNRWDNLIRKRNKAALDKKKAAPVKKKVPKKKKAAPVKKKVPKKKAVAKKKK